MPDPRIADDWSWGWDGGELSVQARARTTRGQAIARYAREIDCDFTDLRAYARHGKPLAKDEQTEDMAWTICAPDDPEGVPIWILIAEGPRPISWREIAAHMEDGDA